MSLIPPESLSFPDDFSRSISRARVLQERQRYAGKKRRGKSRVPPPVKLPAEPPQPAPSPAPVAPLVTIAAAPAPETPTETKVPAAPERTPIARKPLLGKTNARTVAINAKPRPPSAKTPPPVRLPKLVRAENVIVDLAATPPMAKPVVAAPPKQRERVLPLPPVQRRRRKKMRRFLQIEIPSLTLLGLAAAAGLTHQFHDPVATLILNIVTIAAAFITAITPIALFAKSPTLPPNER